MDDLIELFFLVALIVLLVWEFITLARIVDYRSWQGGSVAIVMLSLILFFSGWLFRNYS